MSTINLLVSSMTLISNWLRDYFAYFSPFILLYVIWKLYFFYIQARWIHEEPKALLEIKIPREITKSPKAMEMVLMAFLPSAGSFTDKYILGRVPYWFSLEMVSFGGEIHFYIWTARKHKNLIESQIYSQYPEVEVIEAEKDYAFQVPYKSPGSDWSIWAVEWKLGKEDAMPIKTYIDYEMDKDPKEEFKIDPLTPILEMLGAMKPGDQMWVQVIIRPTVDTKSVPFVWNDPGTWFKKTGWKEDGKKLVDKLSKREKKDKESTTSFGDLMLSSGERKVVEAVERSLAKPGFDAGYRFIYLARGDKFDGGNIGRMMGANKQYNSNYMNGFKPGLFTAFDYPWQDFMDIRVNKRKWKMFDAYRRRMYFYPPYKHKSFVLSSEEVATIFHFPGMVAATPTLPHIESKKGEPPVNLPV